MNDQDREALKKALEARLSDKLTRFVGKIVCHNLLSVMQEEAAEEMLQFARENDLQLVLGNGAR